MRQLGAGSVIVPVWANELGGLTFELTSATGRRFLKWAPRGSGIDLAGELARITWASRFVAVPRVLDAGEDDSGTYLLSEALAGESAVSRRWLARKEAAVRAIGEGLREMHEALPVSECPFSWSATDRLATVRQLAAAGVLEPARWHAEHRRLGVQRALAVLGEVPPPDRLVVCHGDACAPNTLVGEDGHCTGHVDLGSLGVADRWADLAVASWSTRWNYGPQLELPLLDAYGVAPDDERIAYYRLLWDLGP